MWSSLNLDLIATNTARLIVPVIQIFAFYVLGSWSCPVRGGGGFQGGVAMGASFILIALSWDFKTAALPIPHRKMLYRGCSRHSHLCGDWIVFDAACAGALPDYAHLSKVLPVSPEMARCSCDAWGGNWGWASPLPLLFLLSMRVFPQTVACEMGFELVCLINGPKTVPYFFNYWSNG